MPNSARKKPTRARQQHSKKRRAPLRKREPQRRSENDGITIKKRRGLKQTAICCSFRGVLRIHRRWASRFPRSQPHSNWATLGGARKLQQIAVCLRGDARAVTKRRLRGCGGDVSTATIRRLFAGRLLLGCETTFMRLQSDVHAAANRCLFQRAIENTA